MGNSRNKKQLLGIVKASATKREKKCKTSMSSLSSTKKTPNKNITRKKGPWKCA
jgi:hypothetical protein